MTPVDQPSRNWNLEDLAWLLAAVLPSLVLGGGAVRMAAAVAPGFFASRAVQALVYQAAFYACMLGALYLIVSVRYRKPFWGALGWTWRFPGVWRCLVAAPLLMVTISLLGELLRAPLMPNPWEDLITGKGSQLSVLLFVAIIGPAWEELMFRGFLYSVLEERAGPWVAIIGAAIPFGLIHGAQNDWLWQYMFLVALSGVAFGYARHQTGSTAAAALMHSTYNTTLFVVFLVQRL